MNHQEDFNQDHQMNKSKLEISLAELLETVKRENLHVELVKGEELIEDKVGRNRFLEQQINYYQI